MNRGSLIDKLPGPLAIALGLTFFTMLLALFFTLPRDETIGMYSLSIIDFWYDGFWQLLQFTLQMMLILSLGHILALTPPVNAFINNLLSYCDTHIKALFFISFFALLAGFFNWGMGLVFGAIIVRKMGEHAARKGMPVNYPLLGAAGYSCMMVWHGGLSGSAPLTIASPGHFLEGQIGIIPINETLQSGMNLTTTFILLLLIPLFFVLLGRKVKTKIPVFKESKKPSAKVEKISYLLMISGLLLCFTAVYQAMKVDGPFYSIFSLNYMNFLFMGLGMLLMGSLGRYLFAVDDAISGAAGIMIQFPFYAGIMGIMQGSGLLLMMSDFFIDISTAATFPVFTLLSAAIVNVFVPSGGGQWAVQGPVIVEAATRLGVGLPKAIMALAYGDQLTNMIQPFWALPLLAITGLKAKELLPYTFLLMLLGVVVFTTMLIFWP